MAGTAFRMREVMGGDIIVNDVPVARPGTVHFTAERVAATGGRRGIAVSVEGRDFRPDISVTGGQSRVDAAVEVHHAVDIGSMRVTFRTIPPPKQ